MAVSRTWTPTRRVLSSRWSATIGARFLNGIGMERCRTMCGKRCNKRWPKLTRKGAGCGSGTLRTNPRYGKFCSTRAWTSSTPTIWRAFRSSYSADPRSSRRHKEVDNQIHFGGYYSAVRGANRPSGQLRSAFGSDSKESRGQKEDRFQKPEHRRDREAYQT